MKNYKKKSLTILGAGPAGLALGFFAKKKSIQFKIFEKSTQVGGNCKTLTVGDFKFDTGAHRLHDKYDEVTEMIKNLLKDDGIFIFEISYRGSVLKKNTVKVKGVKIFYDKKYFFYIQEFLTENTKYFFFIIQVVSQIITIFNFSRKFFNYRLSIFIYRACIKTLFSFLFRHIYIYIYSGL